MIPSEEQLQIRDTARDFARERLAPHAAQWDREHGFPAEAISRRWASSASWACWCREEWGGAGADHVAYALALEEIAAGDGALLDDHERAQLGRLRADAALRHGRAEGALPEAAGARRDARRASA